MDLPRTNRLLVGAASVAGVATFAAIGIGAVLDDDTSAPPTIDLASETGTVGSGDPGAPAGAPGATVPAGWDDDGLTDSEEDAQLASFAPLGAPDAEAIAQQEVPGTVRRTEIDEDDGRVVWEVEVTTADGGHVEVVVDAGSGAVVETDREDGADGEDD